MTPALRTQRLLIRPLEPADRARWVRLTVENAVFWKPWSPRHDPPRTPDELFEESLARAEQGRRDRTGYRFIALAGEVPVGLCGLDNIVRRAFMNATMGWRVSESAQGRGLAFEMVGRVLAFAFEAEPGGLGLHRVEANIMPRNARSLKLADRLGFRREGLSPRMIRINDVWEDHVRCAVLADERTPGRD